MSKEYDGKLMTTESPTGQMLYGDKTNGERKDEQKQYIDNKLNEGK